MHNTSILDNRTQKESDRQRVNIVVSENFGVFGDHSLLPSIEPLLIFDVKSAQAAAKKAKNYEKRLF